MFPLDTALSVRDAAPLFRAFSGQEQCPVPDPSSLRDTSAVRYLQAGGDLSALQELLALEDPVLVKRYQPHCDQLIEERKARESLEGHEPAFFAFLKQDLSWGAIAPLDGYQAALMGSILALSHLTLSQKKSEERSSSFTRKESS